MTAKILLSIGFLILSGCASITGTTGQNVSVQTREQTGQDVSGAVCELTNNKGKWFVTTPGSVGINRSNDDLQVLCKKENYGPGSASIVSATKGAMFGNIIFGGGIGAVIDHTSGAAYEYPSIFQIVMGSFSRVDPPKNQTSDVLTRPISTGTALSNTSQVHALRSQDERLTELKRLHGAGLITNEAYAAEQREILSR